MDSFDLRQGIIPFSLLEITNHFKQMNTGQRMEIIVGDVSLLNDLRQVLSGAAYRMTELEELNGERRDFRIYLIKEDTQKMEEEHV
jgi:TusA-related sulfurtransferase